MKLLEHQRPLPRHVVDRALAWAKTDPRELHARAKETLAGSHKLLAAAEEKLGAEAREAAAKAAAAERLVFERLADAAGEEGWTPQQLEQRLEAEGVECGRSRRQADEAARAARDPVRQAARALRSTITRNDGARHRRASHGTKTVRCGPRRVTGSRTTSSGEDDPEADPDSLARLAGGPIAPAWGGQ